MRNSNGCWTCRLRRKKCDEQNPVCGNCALLYITCNYDQDKPEWMDGGPKQAEMAEQVKQEVKGNAHLRREERHTHDSGSFVPSEAIRDTSSELLQQGSQPQIEQSFRCSLPDQDERDITQPVGIGYAPHAIGTPESVLLTFYLEQLFPFLFPLYRPSILEGGKAWVLELMIRAPVLRETLLSTSSYFFFNASKADDVEAAWQMLLSRTAKAFGVLGQAMQLIDDSHTSQHLQGASRVLASLMLVQRFEITVVSSGCCQTHLNAALALFSQLMQSADEAERSCPRSSFESVMRRLSSAPPGSTAHGVTVPSAEQAAFRFSSALLIWDDTIDSTTRQRRPHLYDLHRSLLDNFGSDAAAIDISGILGCQNWVLLQIGEISVLDVWKEQCTQEGNLDVMHLVWQAEGIKATLLAGLEKLRTGAICEPNHHGTFFEAPFMDQSQLPLLATQVPLVTGVWAHAALLYLIVVVSGWQPASREVRGYVESILQLLNQRPLPTLLRTMIWPFLIAACLAETSQEQLFRNLANSLQPAGVLGITRRLLSIMENAWKNRDAGKMADWNLAKCFHVPE